MVQITVNEAEIRRLYYQKANALAIRDLKKENEKRFKELREGFLQEFVERHLGEKNEAIIQ